MIVFTNNRSEGKVFVSKPVAKSVFEISKELQAEFGKTRNLRTHIDESTEGFVLIYEAYIDDLLGFIKSNPPLTLESRKFILREVGEGLKKLHDSNWVHLGLLQSVCPAILIILTITAG